MIITTIHVITDKTYKTGAISHITERVVIKSNF